MKRRDFLKTGLKIGVAANTLPMLLGGMPLRALGRSPLRSGMETLGTVNNNVLVIIQLQGGNDGLNCVVPTSSSPQYSNYSTLRPTLGLLSASDLTPALPGHTSLAFHNAMGTSLNSGAGVYNSGMWQLFNESKIAILQNVGYPNPILSHFRGSDIWNTATDSGIYAPTGWVGRFLVNQYGVTSTAPNSWPLGIEFGNALSDIFLAANGGMGIAMNAMPSKAAPGGQSYDAIPANPTTQYDELAFVRLIQQESEVYSATIVNRSVTTNMVPYPTSALATQLAGIAQMIASQLQTGAVQTKIYLVTQASYDTHGDQISRQASLLTDLSAAVLAFQQDIEAMGIDENVAMMTYSEFGRRVVENGSGTDHGTSAPHFVIGTQVIGQVYGSDPDLSTTAQGGINNNNEGVPGNLAYDPIYDFRNVYATMISDWLLVGADPTAISAVVQDVLTQDSTMTYSTEAPWVPLNIFKTTSGVYPASAPGAVGLMLLQNYPNPAIGITTIPFMIDVAGPVQLSVFSSDGVEVARPVEGWQSAGQQSVSFDVSKLAAGAYFYQLKTSTQTVTQPMVVAH
jgi:uncharacterized protein (DUF1501 family)